MPTSAEVARYLRRHHWGHENAVSNAGLSETLGLTDRGSSGRHGLRNSHRLTALLNEARGAGHPICADNRGIYYARYREEAEATIAHQRHCAQKYIAAAELLSRAAATLPSAATTTSVSQGADS